MEIHIILYIPISNIVSLTKLMHWKYMLFFAILNEYHASVFIDFFFLGVSRFVLFIPQLIHLDCILVSG